MLYNCDTHVNAFVVEVSIKSIKHLRIAMFLLPYLAEIIIIRFHTLLINIETTPPDCSGTTVKTVAGIP